MVDLAQPQGRLARTLLSEQTPLADEFVSEQESRRDRGLNHELYDVTAWSLPLMFGLETKQCNRASISDTTIVTADDPIMPVGSVGAEFGYIIPWTDSGQARLVIAALQERLKGKTTDEPFTYEGETYPSGSAIFTIAANSPYLGRNLSELATEIGAEFIAMDTSWVEDGPNFGSSSFATLKLPKVALAWGEGTSPTSAGSMRYVLERKLGLPVATIRVSSMSRADLSDYDVVILPDSYGDMLDTFGRASLLEDFVEGGGVLIAIDGALAELSSSDLGLISTKREYAVSEGDQKDEDDAEASRVEGTILETVDEYEAYIHDHRASPEDIPGVLVKVEANTDHWLSAGYDSAIALVTGRDIYRPLNEADGVNIFRFADADELLVSGYLWEENRVQLAYKPFVMVEEVGQGVTIGFTQSPATRAYLDGLNLLIANAVIIGPSRVAH